MSLQADGSSTSPGTIDGVSVMGTHLEVDNTLCMRCGNCCVSCPINKQEDPQLGATGTSSSDEVIMRIEDGRVQILHEEKCTGCKTCETNCPNQAIRVARMVEGVHEEVEA